MEGLEKLEDIQRTIHLLHCFGISDANPEAERFLADFTCLLMERCGELDVTSKYQLISKNMSKILSLVGDLQTGPEGGVQIEKPVKLSANDERNVNPLYSLYGDKAMVGVDAVMRSNSSLEDFVRSFKIPPSYFMFHGMEANQPESIFRYLPMLSFTESYIYQLDDLNEKLSSLLPRDGSELEAEFKDDDSNIGAKCVRLLGKEPFRPLLILLEHIGVLTERIKEELRCGEEYWYLERKLCYALLRNKEITIEDVTRAIHLKSFDYRVLNLLLYQLKAEKNRGTINDVESMSKKKCGSLGGFFEAVLKVNELHMEFLSISELLVEVSDDLFDYEDDVVENNFNILRMFAKYYGASAAPIMLARFITEAEEKCVQLSKTLDPELLVMYHKRCEEATKEGGKRSGPSLGTWVIPPVIEDENAYRSEFSNSSP